MLLSCGKTSNTLTTQMVSASFHQLISCIGSESDPSFLASLSKCFTDSLKVMGGPTALSQEFHNGVVEALKRQLQTLADKRKNRSQRPASELADDKEDLALIEEIEDFALEDMAKLLYYMDPKHPLLIAVSSVKDLGLNEEESDDDGDDERSFFWGRVFFFVGHTVLIHILVNVYHIDRWGGGTCARTYWPSGVSITIK